MKHSTLQELRDTYNATELALRKTNPSAYRDLQNEPSGDHPSDYRRHSAKARDYYNQLVRDTNSRKDTTETELQAMECLAAMAGIYDKLADEKAEFMSSNWTVVDGSPIHSSDRKRIFNKGERISSEYRSERLQGVNLGSIMAAMAGVGPRSPAVQNALSEGTDSAGGFTAPVEILQEFIDLMRAKSQLINAGARTVLIEAKKSNIATIATDPVAGWRAENAPVSESDMVLGNVQFTPKSLAVLVRVSRELMQDSLNIQEMLLTSLAQGLATQLDFAGLYGTGASNQPTGLDSLLTTATRVTTLAANGSKLSALGNYKPLVAAAAQVANSNDQATSVIMAPRTAYDLGALADTTGQPLQAPAIIQRMQLLDTTSIPTNLTVGTASGVCSEAFVGNFDKLLLGLRQELRIEVDTSRYVDNLQVAFIAYLRADWQPARIGSFWKVRGILAE